MSVHALYTGYSALNASRVGLEVVSNNIANVNTEGYSRQRLELQAFMPTSLTFGQIGNGVDISDIARSRDVFLDERVRSATGSLGALETRAELLARAEAALGEPEHGITAGLDALWDSFEGLALSPTNRAAQLTVMEELDATSARLRSLDHEIEAVGEATRRFLEDELDTVNELTARIADLNVAILRERGGGSAPNNLLDMRDVAVDELVSMTGASARIDDNGNYQVAVNGLSLVLGSEHRTLSFDASTDSIVHDALGAAINVGGSTGGAQQFLQEDLVAMSTGLGTIASEFADAVNAQHAAGFSDSGVAGAAVFSYDAAAPASTIALALTDPSQLASSDVDGTPFPAFNGENAQRLADLRYTAVAVGGTQSLGDAARALVIEVGSRVATARSSAAAQADLATAAQLSREQVTGVNLDEEMVELMRFQQSYAAAARVITTADAALDILVNRTGLVGR